MCSSMARRKWRHILILVMGFVECLLFAGVLFGWPSLVYILKADGVYGYQCNNQPGESDSLSDSATTRTPDNQSSLPPIFVTPETRQALVNRFASSAVETNVSSNSSDISDGSVAFQNACSASNKLISLAYILAIVVVGATAFPIGALFDKFGLMVTRLFASSCFAAGILMLGYADDSWSWVIFPGAELLGIGCVTTVIINSHLCILGGSRTFTVMCLYNGGVNMGAAVALLLKLMYDAGLPRRHTFTALAIACVTLVYLNSFLLMPKYKPLDTSQEKEREVTVTVTSNGDSRPDGTISTDSRSQTNDISLKSGVPDSDIKDPDSKDPTGDLSKDMGEPPSLLSCIRSPLYLYYLLWKSVHNLTIQHYFSMFNYWLVTVYMNDSSQVSFYTNVNGYVQMSGLLVAPLAGIIVDLGRRGSKSTFKAVAAAPPLLLASLFGIFLSASILISVMTTAPSSVQVVSAMLFAEFFRSFFFSTSIAFCEIAFPVIYFGKLYGLAYGVSAAFSFLDYPLLSWIERVPGGFYQSQILLVVLGGVSLLHPLNVWRMHCSSNRASKSHEDGHSSNRT